MKSYLKRHNMKAYDTINPETYNFMPSIEVKAIDISHPMSVKLGIIKNGKLDLWIV